MKKWFISAIAAFGALTSANLCAAQILTLEDCLQRARANSVQLKNIDAAVQNSRYSGLTLKALRYPQIKTAGNLSWAPYTSRIGYDPAITSGGQVGAQVVLQQTLYAGGAGTLKMRQNQKELEQLQIYSKKGRKDLDAAVRRQFYEVMRADGEIGIRQEAVKRLLDYAELVQLQYHGGAVGYGDMLKIKVQQAAADEMLSKALETAFLARFDLANLMGTPLDTSLQIGENLDTLLARTPDSAAVLDTAKVYDLQAASGEIQKNILDLNLIKQEKYPSIALSLDGGYLSSMDRFYSAETKNSLGFSAGVSLEIPLIDWGGLSYRQAQQQLAIDTLLRGRTQLAAVIMAEYRADLMQLNNARVLLLSIKQRFKNTTDDYLLTKSKYAAGAASSAELLMAQQALTDTRLDELQTKVTILSLRTRIDQLSSQ